VAEVGAKLDYELSEFARSRVNALTRQRESRGNAGTK
jgi:hypothetical protein